MSASVFKQIADEVGVSPRTVRRVLNGTLRDSRPSIVERTQRIHDLAAALNYRPNAAAKAVASGRFGSFGLLTATELRLSQPGRYLHGIQSACREHNIHLTVGDVPDEQLSQEGYVPKILREWSVDGLLISYSHELPPHMREVIRRNQIPCVWINIKLEHDCVYPDDYAGARLLTERLIGLGHRRLSFMAHPVFGLSEHYSCEERWRGFADACAAAGLQPMDQRGWGLMEGADAVAHMRACLKPPDRSTAVVAYGGTSALLVVAASLGLSVPRDLSIAGFSREPMDDAGVSVARAVVPDDACGRAAVEMLIEKLRRPNRRLRPRPIPETVAEGDTLAPPPDR